MHRKTGFSIWRRHPLFVICMSSFLSGINFITTGLFWNSQTGRTGSIVLGVVFVLTAPIMATDTRPENRGVFSMIVSIAGYFAICIILAVVYSPIWLVFCTVEILIGYIVLYLYEKKRMNRGG